MKEHHDSSNNSKIDQENETKFNLSRWFKQNLVPAILKELRDPDFPALAGAVIIMCLMMGAAYYFRKPIEETFVGGGKKITYQVLGLNTGPHYCYTLPVRIGPTTVGPEYPVKHVLISQDGEPNFQNQAYITTIKGIDEQYVVCEGDPSYDRLEGKVEYFPEEEQIPPTLDKTPAPFVSPADQEEN